MWVRYVPQLKYLDTKPVGSFDHIHPNCAYFVLPSLKFVCSDAVIRLQCCPILDFLVWYCFGDPFSDILGTCPFVKFLINFLRDEEVFSLLLFYIGTLDSLKIPTASKNITIIITCSWSDQCERTLLESVKALLESTSGLPGRSP